MTMMDSSHHLRTAYAGIVKQEDKYWNDVYFIASLASNEQELWCLLDDVKRVFKTKHGQTNK